MTVFWLMRCSVCRIAEVVSANIADKAKADVHKAGPCSGALVYSPCNSTILTEGRYHDSTM